MAIIKVAPDDVELFTIVTTPRQEFLSSSSGVTGSVKIFPRASVNEKETAYPSAFVDSSAIIDDKFDSTFDSLVVTARTNRAVGNPVTAQVGAYFEMASKAAAKRTKSLNVERFTPTTNLSTYTTSKNNIKDMLMPFYRNSYPDAVWAYTNYNSLNFFITSSNSYSLPTSSVFLYPNKANDVYKFPVDQHSGSYCLPGAFSFSFHINPRYRSDGIDAGHFKAGTLFHLHNNYALSLVTGSSRDVNGMIDGYRLLLQLSSSADVPPSMATPYSSDMIYMSEDNSLSWNKWHHVVVRWGTNAINEGTGSFIIDGIERGTFVLPSSSIGSKFSGNPEPPSALCVGNYYEGTNTGNDALKYFFAVNLANYDGVDWMSLFPSFSYEGPQSYKFRHPLKAEVHDLMIYRKYLSDSEVAALGTRGGSTGKDLIFYVPPFFIQDTRFRYTSAAPKLAGSGERGGVLQDPYFSTNGTTDDPFNVAMAFGAGGHYINLENFVKDFATNRSPRMLSLTASMAPEVTPAPPVNDVLYRDPGVAKRNLTIVPCDDGKFDPNYEVLKSEKMLNKFVDPSGTPRLDYINLDNVLLKSSLVTITGDPTSPEYDKLLIAITKAADDEYIKSIGAVIDSTKFDRGIQAKRPLIVFQRLQDPSSDQVTIFNISNLYYGRRILPGSFQIRDVAMTGSLGQVVMTLQDDGVGGLYRADSLTPPAKFNCVGNIFYDEGIVLIKSPHLYFFGKHQFEMSFRGVQNVYSTKYEIVAPAGLLNSSSSPSHGENYENLRSSERLDDDAEFVYISGMNLHDENMNVMARVKLSQPIIKRQGDKLLFKLALDW